MKYLKDIWEVTKRECKILYVNRIYGYCMVVFPLLAMLFFTSLLNDGVPQEMPVGIVDLDNTSMTRALGRKLDGFQNSKVVANYTSVSEARKAMQENEIYGFLYLPKGTTEKLLASRRPTVSFYYSQTSLSAGSMVMKDLKTTATLGMMGVGQATMRAKGLTEKQIQTLLQPIRIDLHQVVNPWSNYNIYLSTVFVPGVMMLFMFLISAYSLGMELKFGRGKEWLAMADNNIVVAILGKYLPQALIFTSIIFFYECASGVQFYRLRRLHLRSDAFASNVDEYLFAVGCAQFLAGRIRFPHDGYGRLFAGDDLALPLASLLYALSDYGV